MGKDISKVNFRTTIAAQDKIKGRLVSGQWFTGKVYSCGDDYFAIVELKVGSSPDSTENQGTDITSMRYDAVMFFDKDE